MIMNVEPPFELGECTEITLKVYMPKDTDVHFGDNDILTQVIANRLNNLYAELVQRPHWQSPQLWFKPKVMKDE